MSSSQLTFIFFQRGRSTTNQFSITSFPQGFPHGKMDEPWTMVEYHMRKTWKTIIIITLENPKKSIRVESPTAIPQRRDARHLCQSAMERWEKKTMGNRQMLFLKSFCWRVFTYHICLTYIYIHVCVYHVYIFFVIYLFIYL